jgi:hypothetical protein
MNLRVTKRESSKTLKDSRSGEKKKAGESQSFAKGLRK